MRGLAHLLVLDHDELLQVSTTISGHAVATVKVAGDIVDPVHLLIEVRAVNIDDVAAVVILSFSILYLVFLHLGMLILSTSAIVSVLRVLYDGVLARLVGQLREDVVRLLSLLGLLLPEVLVQLL